MLKSEKTIGLKMSSKTIKSGNASATIKTGAADVFASFLNTVIPNTSRLIDKEFTQIIQDAKKDWLIREKRSQRSIDKFYMEKKITKNEVIFTIGNSAPYSWAIFVGKDSKRTSLKEGTRLARTLLVKPAERAADRIAKQLAREI